MDSPEGACSCARARVQNGSGSATRGSGRGSGGATVSTTASFLARELPSATRRISLQLPTQVPATACGATAAQTAADTLGRVGMRIYNHERMGTRAVAVMRYLERLGSFRRAVAAGDVTATQAAIVGVFRTHLHVVRVRVSRSGRLFVDLGGPNVLAPIAGILRDANGRVVGRFLTSIQDDLGYVLLAHSFTGAQVLLRIGARQAIGTLSPGPTNIPARGTIFYRGVAYQAFSFDAQAFPSGPLRISLLVPMR